jgi:tetratricopeptide (TPR) repeat protein
MPPPSTHARHALAAILVGATLLAGACAGRRSTPAETPPDPAETARQLDRATGFVRQAQRYELDHRETDAIAEYRKAIDEYRDLPVAWNNLGNLLQKRGENLAAADAFKTASELSPTDPRPVHNLGTLWENLGYIDDAARWYDEALKRDENYLPSLRRMLVIEETRNRPDEQTLDHIRRGLLVERDPWWIDRFKQSRLRLEQMLKDAQADALPR